MKLQKNLSPRLVSIILGVLVVGGVVYFTREIPPRSDSIKVCKIPGVRVDLPNGLKYGCDTFTGGTFSRLGVTYWKNPMSDKDLKILFDLGIDEFSDRTVFDNYVKDTILNDSRFKFNLINSDYQIDGTSGLYYEDELATERDSLRRIITVPSKLAVISITEVKYRDSLNVEADNTSKINLNSIINSISFEKVSNNKPSQQGLNPTRICLTNDMSVMLPDRSDYSCSTTESNIFSRIIVSYYDSSMVNVTDSGGTPTLFSMEKIINQEEFKGGSTVDNAYFHITDSNYPIHGTTGLYYEGKKSNLGSRIVVPSKSIIIGIDSLDSLQYYGVNDALKNKLKKEVDSIINSISF